MRARIDFILRGLVVVCALGLAWAFFKPWVMSPGGGVSAPHLRETLQGPHQFLSMFKKDNRISRNYRLAPYLWSLPAGAGVAGVWALWPSAPLWPGLVVGALAVGETRYMQAEIAEIPFHREGPGIGLTQRLGWVMAGASALRLFTRRAKRRARS